ncbi:MAG: hypothetical protein KA174_03835 [Chitinophagales bacterium]|nr:hypothetical protein [Chitinophagales bacterium]
MKHYKIKIFILFFLIVFGFYFPVQYSKYVCDTTYAFNQINSTGIKGIIYSYCMPHYIAYIPSIITYLMYKIFGFHWFGWHVVFSLLHSLNGLLLFVFLKNILPIKFPKYVAFIATLLFLISPFQSEVIAWGILIYLLVVAFLLSGLLFLIKYFEKNKHIYLIGFHLSFFASLLCFELPVVFPFIYLVFVVLVLPRYSKFSIRESLLFYLKKILIYNLGIILFYFILTKLTFGKWMMHYGSSVITNANMMTLFDNFLKYQLKFIVFYRYLPDKIIHILNTPSVHFKLIYIIVVFLVSLIVYVLYKKQYKYFSVKLLFFLVISYVLMLIPFLNLDTSFVFEIQSDRYGYIASLFFYPIITIFLFKILNKYLFALFAMAETIICVVLLIHATHAWHRSGDLALSLVKQFPVQPNQKAFILNLPDNYKGAYTFRNCFNEYLTAFHHKNYLQSIEVMAGVNVFSKNNETDVEQKNDSTYYVKCTVNGKWYYHNCGGAVDYETESYKVDFDEWNTAYTLTIKQNPSETMYLLQCVGDKWKIVDTIIHKNYIKIPAIVAER